MIAGQDWAALASLVTSNERQFRRLATAFPFPLSHFRTPNAPAGIDTACRLVAQPREHDDALAKRLERGDEVLRVDLPKPVQFDIIALDAGRPNGVR